MAIVKQPPQWADESASIRETIIRWTMDWKK